MESILKDFFSLILEGSFPSSPTDYLLEELEVCFPKIQGHDFILCMTHTFQDYELHKCMICSPVSLKSLQKAVFSEYLHKKKGNRNIF